MLFIRDGYYLYLVLSAQLFYFRSFIVCILAKSLEFVILKSY